MVTDPVLQWALTLAFLATASYAGIRILVDRSPLLAVGNVLHLAMSLTMIAMCWPWWSVIPRGPQLVVFAGGLAWFLLILVLQLIGRVSRAAIGGHSAWHQAAHALMMLAMVWMIVVMPAGDSASGHSHHHGSLELWPALSGVALTAALLTSGAVFVVEFLVSSRERLRWIGHTGDVVSGAVMSIGMALMCWPMIAG